MCAVDIQHAPKEKATDPDKDTDKDPDRDDETQTQTETTRHRPRLRRRHKHNDRHRHNHKQPTHTRRSRKATTFTTLVAERGPKSSVQQLAATRRLCTTLGRAPLVPWRTTKHQTHMLNNQLISSCRGFQGPRQNRNMINKQISNIWHTLRGQRHELIEFRLTASGATSAKPKMRVDLSCVMYYELKKWTAC